jgi:hypothetical protein
MVFQIARRLGVLRSMLVLLTLSIILAMPFADVSQAPSGWGLIRSAVLPAAGPIVFMVLMLDLMMCQIFKADADETRRADLNFIIKIYLVLAAVLVLVWLPAFLKATYF